MENKDNGFMIKDVGRVKFSNGYLIRDHSCLTLNNILKSVDKYIPVYPEIEKFLDREEKNHNDKRISLIDIITRKNKTFNKVY